MNTDETKCLAAMENVSEDLRSMCDYLNDIRDESIYAHERHYLKTAIEKIYETVYFIEDNMDMIKNEHTRRRQKNLDLF